MQFLHPEILHFLWLLIIPIIIHLFQLQRFKKVPFTNVELLKKIEVKTRKSSQLKKWLILVCRLGLFTSIILAFAQPFFSITDKNQSKELILYVDNSFSMSVQKSGSEHLNNEISRFLDNVFLPQKTTLITNDEIIENLPPETLKDELIKLKYSAKKTDFKTLFLQLENLRKQKTNTLYKTVFITDFQCFKDLKNSSVTDVNSPVSAVFRVLETTNNKWIDSAYITSKSNLEITLNIQLNSEEKSNIPVPVSLFLNDTLIAKSSADFSEKNSLLKSFNFPMKNFAKGKIEIEDNTLLFDNILLFSLEKNPKLNVLTIGKNNSFLNRIFTSEEFNFNTSENSNFDQSFFNKQDLVILNEIESINPQLNSLLKNYSDNGGNLVFIPSLDTNIASYNSILSEISTIRLGNFNQNKQYVSEIKFDHPIFKDVFEKRVSNFEAPLVNSFYELQSANQSSLLNYDNQFPFVVQANPNTFVFTSSISEGNSNFKSSPLIVPLFYNFAVSNAPFPKLYYSIGEENQLNFDYTLSKDEIVEIKNESSSFIPLQSHNGTSVKVFTKNNPSIAGYYTITHQDKPIKTVAYNYNRTESRINNPALKQTIDANKQIEIVDDYKALGTKISSQFEIKTLFKWFLGLAVLFLLLEMCILKFLKV